MLTGFVYFILPAILLLLGLPIFVVLLLTSLAAIVFVAHVPLQAIQTYMFGSLDNFPLLAVPFFVLAGEIMGRGGIANRVVNWVVSIVGGVRGSLAVTTVASSELFGAMAHTSVGTVVAIGRLLFPSLTKHGYSERFAIALITSSGAVAVIIPPSISMILYAMSAQVSAIKLFTAGILPSLLDRPGRCGLCTDLRQDQGGAAVGAGAVEEYLGLHQRRELGDRHHRRDFRRHLWRRVHANRSGRRRRGLFAVRCDVHLSRGQACRTVADRRVLGRADLANPRSSSPAPESIPG